MQIKTYAIHNQTGSFSRSAPSLCNLIYVPFPTMSSYIPNGKPDLTPRRHHGYAAILFVVGTLFPPLGN